MKCEKCGNEVREGSIFCGVCGSRLMVEGLRSKHEIEFTDAPLDTRAEVLKPKKKSGGCCGCFFSFLIVILVIFGIIKLLGWYKQYSYNKFVEETLLVDTIGDIKLTEEEAKEDWNNDGISNERAEELGLNIVSFDSDGDGLSDADEINIYKSDPLKYSTMDDIYSDGDKVTLGYDLTKRYETFAILKTANPSLMVEIDDAHDMKFYYKDYKGLIPDGYYLGFQPFRLYSFEGEVDLTLENPENYKVISYDALKEKVVNIKSRVENNNLVFTVSDDNPILIVYKDSVLKKMDVNAMASINGKYSNNVKKEYFVITFPIVNFLLKHPVYVLEIDNGITSGGGSDLILQEEINKKVNGKFKIEHYFTNERGIRILESMLSNLSSQIYSNVGEENKSFIDYIITYRRISGKNELFKYLISNYDDSAKEETEEDVIYDTTDPFGDKYSNMSCTYCADSGFRVGVNAFPFQNLSTEVSFGGVCAGFSYITTNVYNNGRIPKTLVGKYDMSGNEYNNIWNKNLYNYKPTDKDLILYADLERNNENKLNSSTMSKPDSEVVKALEYYWDDYNKDTRMTKFGWAWNSSFDKMTFIDASTVDNLVKQFKQNKIVSVSLLSDSQHAVNAYMITEDRNDSDILYIKAYDNNLPNDMFWNADSNDKVKYDVTIILKRIYENTLFGTKVKYAYTYDPIGSSSYNYGTYNKTYDGILFLDENNKVL